MLTQVVYAQRVACDQVISDLGSSLRKLHSWGPFKHVLPRAPVCHMYLRHQATPPPPGAPLCPSVD